MSRPSSCNGVYGLTSAISSLGSLIQRNGTTMVTTVPIMMTAAARSRNMTGFFSIMTSPFLRFLRSGNRFAGSRRLEDVVDEEEQAHQVDEPAQCPAVPVGIQFHQRFHEAVVEAAVRVGGIEHGRLLHAGNPHA